MQTPPASTSASRRLLFFCIKMAYQLAAEAVLALHLLVVMFVIAGGLLVLWRPRLAWIHLPVVLWCTVVNVAGWTCPLTPAENLLRNLAGDAGYQGTFIEQYIAPIVYPGGMTRELEWTAGVSLPVWNVLIYVWIWRRAARRGTGAAGHEPLAASR